MNAQVCSYMRSADKKQKLQNAIESRDAHHGKHRLQVYNIIGALRWML